MPLQANLRSVQGQPKRFPSSALQLEAGSLPPTCTPILCCKREQPERTDSLVHKSVSKSRKQRRSIGVKEHFAGESL